VMDSFLSDRGRAVGVGRILSFLRPISASL
jgi:hypothetical protein